MKEKLMKILRKVEIALLKFFVAIYKGLGKFGAFVKRVIWPKWQSISRTVLLAVIAVYVIGGVIFGIRLYKQHRFEKPDLFASYIYPFPVANAGRGMVFDRQLQLWVNSSKTFAQKNSMEVPADLAQSIVKELNDYNMVSQEANRIHVGLKSKEIDDKFDLTIEGIGSKEQAADFLKQMYGLSMNQFKSLITPMILVEKVKEEKFVKVKVRHILIADEKKAKEVAEKAKKGDNFDELAKQNSEDQSSKDAGGLIAEGQYLFKESGLVPEFEDAMFKMKVGEISDPVKSQYGYHIIKVEDRKGEIDMKYSDWLNDLRKKYPQRVWL
jgi:hypothetical protein